MQQPNQPKWDGIAAARRDELRLRLDQLTGELKLNWPNPRLVCLSVSGRMLDYLSKVDVAVKERPQPAAAPADWLTRKFRRVRQSAAIETEAESVWYSISQSP